MSESKFTFVRDYNAHKQKIVTVTVTVMNAMDCAIGVYKDTRQVRHVENHTGSVTFQDLGTGATWEGHSLIVVANVIDTNLNSDRMAVEIEIDGGAAPVTEQLFKHPSVDKEAETFVGKFKIS